MRKRMCILVLSALLFIAVTATVGHAIYQHLASAAGEDRMGGEVERSPLHTALGAALVLAVLTAIIWAVVPRTEEAGR